MFAEWMGVRASCPHSDSEPSNPQNMPAVGLLTATSSPHSQSSLKPEHRDGGKSVSWGPKRIGWNPSIPTLTSLGGA